MKTQVTIRVLQRDLDLIKAKAGGRNRSKFLSRLIREITTDKAVFMDMIEKSLGGLYDGDHTKSGV